MKRYTVYKTIKHECFGDWVSAAKHFYSNARHVCGISNISTQTNSKKLDLSWQQVFEKPQGASPRLGKINLSILDFIQENP